MYVPERSLASYFIEPQIIIMALILTHIIVIVIVIVDIISTRKVFKQKQKTAWKKVKNYKVTAIFRKSLNSDLKIPQILA